MTIPRRKTGLIRWRGALGGALLAVACAGGDEAENPASGPDVEPGGTAVIGVTAAATTLLPPLAAAALDFELGSLLYLPLNTASWGNSSLEFAADRQSLARSWEISSEPPALSYHLDTSRRWSDGQPVVAADVVFTYELLADTTLGLPLGSTTSRIRSVEALDDSTVQFRFDREYPGMLFDTGVGILPAHVFGPIGREEMRGMPTLAGSAPSGLVVSGPFALSEWEPSQRIVLLRNEGSVHPAILDRVVIRVTPDETTRLAELRTGGIDVAQLQSYRTAARLAGDTTISLARIPQRGFDYIAWNPEAHPAFADPDVRRAFSLAIDRQRFIAALDMDGFAEPAYGPYGSLFASLETPSPEDPAFDLGRARELLDASGWLDADGDGVRERDGVDLRFELVTTTGNERRESAAQILQAALAELGAAIEIRMLDLQSALGLALQRDYEAALLGWQIGLDPDISAFWGDPESPLNVVGFSNPTVAATIDSALSSESAGAAAPYWRRAGIEISSEHPYAWLWYFDQLLAVGPRLRGVTVDVVGFGPGMDRWWIPTKLRRQP